jgi:toxin ParE1/3/4
MGRYHLSRSARADLAHILATSAETWGEEGRRRYAPLLAAALLAAAMRQAARDPGGRMTRDRRELSQGLRSLHLRHVRPEDPSAKVKRPVHCLYYRPIEPGLIEIIRVLHERMEPNLHLAGSRPR